MGSSCAASDRCQGATALPLDNAQNSRRIDATHTQRSDYPVLIDRRGSPMPTEIVSRAVRERIRKSLQGHKTDFEVSNGKIAAFIEENQEKLGGTISAETIGRFFDMAVDAVTISPRHVLLLGRYLEMVKRETAQPETEYKEETDDGPEPQPADPIHDQNFKMLRTQFEVDDSQVSKIAAEYRGIYQFVAHSEETRHHAVFGAMTLFHGSKNMERHSKTMALLCREVQRGQKAEGPHRSFERWVGYFLECGNTCVIFQQSRSLHIPKIYILLPERRERGTRRVTSMHGRMMKVGTSGGVFTSRIVLRRNKHAYDSCDLVPFTDCPRDIQLDLSDPN
jgi:hypothetical protein